MAGYPTQSGGWRQWRPMTWVLILWSAPFAVFMVIVLNVTGDCTSESESGGGGCVIGGGIVAVPAFFVWLVGFVLLLAIWHMTKPERRPCPACGYEMPKGTTQCAYCGYSAFAATGWNGGGTAAQPATLSSPAGWYPDPEGVALYRWWDGQVWTEHLHGIPSGSAPRGGWT